MQTFTGLEYLKIDLANCFGLDKSDWSDRLAWTDANMDNLKDRISEAEEPAMFYASMQALNRAQQGLASGYPVSLDATASGLQILACLTGCESSARHTNLIDTGHRQDAYTNLYQVMIDAMGEVAKIGRKDTKQAIMTAYFNSENMPKKVFGEGELLQTFYTTLETETPGAWELTTLFLAMWNPVALKYDWVLPDNFHVSIKVESTQKDTVHFLNEPFDVVHKVNAPQEKGRSLGANTVHSVDGMVAREMNRRCGYRPDMIETLVDNLKSTGNSETRVKDQLVLKLWDHYQKSGFLSARILSQLDKDNMGHVDPEVIMAMIMTLPKKPFEVISNHDCFRCLPNYGNDLRKQYNQILSDIAKSNLLAYIVSQILGTQIQVNKKADISQRILQADYALS